MGTPYLGEIRIVSFGFAPKGWAFCNGQTLPINQNQALFALLGTQYGGNGQTTFQLPNLQGCMPIHAGNGYVQGSRGGEASHTLLVQEMPQHNHLAQAVASNATVPMAVGNLCAVTAQNAYAAGSNITFRSDALSATGGSQPHNNLPPYLVLNFVIALQGIFPSRN